MHKHQWEFVYQISHIPYNFNTSFCECGIKKVEREAFDKIEETKESAIDSSDRAYAEKIKQMIEE